MNAPLVGTTEGQLGLALAQRWNRIWFWAEEAVRTATPEAARAHYESLLVSTCTDLWSAFSKVTPADCVPPAHLLPVGLARSRIAYRIWASAAIMAQRDYTLGCQIEQCGAPWLDSAHEISRRLRTEPQIGGAA